MSQAGPKSDAAPVTRHVRCRVDLVEKMLAIRLVEGETVTDQIDQHMRAAIEKRFAKLPEAFRERAMKRIAAAEAES